MIKVTIRGSQELLAVMKLIPNRMRLALFKAAKDTAIAIQSLAKKNAPVARGLLRASIAFSASIEGDRVIGQVGSALPYADVVELGRAQGWLPNIKQLMLWGIRRKGSARKGYLAALRIQERGFRARPYLKPALDEVGPRAQLIFTGRILEALAEASGGSPPGGG